MQATATCGHAVDEHSQRQANVKVDFKGKPGVATVVMCPQCQKVHKRNGVILQTPEAEREWLALPRAVGATW